MTIVMRAHVCFHVSIGTSNPLLSAPRRTTVFFSPVLSGFSFPFFRFSSLFFFFSSHIPANERGTVVGRGAQPILRTDRVASTRLSSLLTLSRVTRAQGLPCASFEPMEVDVSAGFAATGATFFHQLFHQLLLLLFTTASSIYRLTKTHTLSTLLALLTPCDILSTPHGFNRCNRFNQ